MISFELHNEKNDEYLIALKRKYQMMTIFLLSVCTLLFVVLCCI